MNTQKITKPRWNDEGDLQVHSIFRTIQGEGPFIGQPAIFVRLQGCNLRCPLCDTEYSTGIGYSADGLADLIDLMAKESISLVVITGGEPFTQNIKILVAQLMDQGYAVQIETNGTYIDPRQEDFFRAQLTHPLFIIVCSPKTDKVNPFFDNWLIEYKYIVHYASMALDGLPQSALRHSVRMQIARPPDLSPVWLQPEDSGNKQINERNTNACIESCLKHGYRFTPQLHKYIGLP